MRRVVILALLSMLAIPAGAYAYPAGPLLGMAKAYWGREVSCPSYELKVEAITDLSNAVGEAQAPGCWMRIAPEAWNTYRVSEVCDLVVHEYGHSLGYPHNSDPTSVMDPEAIYTTGAPPGCAALETEWQAKLQAEAQQLLESEIHQERAQIHISTAYHKRHCARRKHHRVCP